MEDAITTETTFWCHMCSRSVNPLIEGEIIECNFCQSGFIEEMHHNPAQESATIYQAADSIWDPILMEVMNSHDQNSTNQGDSESTVDNNDENTDGESDISGHLEEIRRLRSRHSTAIVNLLQEIRSGLLIDSETNEGNPELMILINSLNQRIRAPQDSIDTTSVPSGSLGDYFIGPEFDSLLERLADLDLNNRYGTPPASKESMEALEMVKIKESLLQCTVCLDVLEIGTEAKEMPCKHKFHSDCLLRWLELHSSCPVCRYLLPTADEDGEQKTNAETSRNDDNNDDISIDSMLVNDGYSSSNNSSAN